MNFGKSVLFWFLENSENKRELQHCFVVLVMSPQTYPLLTSTSLTLSSNANFTRSPHASKRGPSLIYYWSWKWFHAYPWSRVSCKVEGGSEGKSLPDMEVAHVSPPQPTRGLFSFVMAIYLRDCIWWEVSLAAVRSTETTTLRTPSKTPVALWISNLRQAG